MGGDLNLATCTNFDQAVEILQRAANTDEPERSHFDVVVSELRVGRRYQAGLEILALLDVLWESDPALRPAFCLLTSRRDPEVVAKVKSRRKSFYIRHDDPELIFRSLQACDCIASVVPKDLPLMSNSAVEDGPPSKALCTRMDGNVHPGSSSANDAWRDGECVMLEGQGGKTPSNVSSSSYML